MSNIKVQIFVESRYKVSRKKITETIQRMVGDRGLSSPLEISVAVVGDRKMRSLNKKYRNLDKTTNILSFPQNEGSPMKHDLSNALLGDLVISYPEMIKEASFENMLLDDKINYWIEHGMKHLLGEHH